LNMRLLRIVVVVAIAVTIAATIGWKIKINQFLTWFSWKTLLWKLLKQIYNGDLNLYKYFSCFNTHYTSCLCQLTIHGLIPRTHRK
jgi:hypothetical protein